MYSGGWGYAGAFLAIIWVRIALWLYSLGAFELREDEFQTVSTAVGYLNTGGLEMWDFLQGATTGETYTRAFP